MIQRTGPFIAGVTIFVGGWGLTQYASAQQASLSVASKYISKSRAWTHGIGDQFSSSTIFAVGVVLMATGAGFIAWSLTKKPEPQEKTPAEPQPRPHPDRGPSEEETQELLHPSGVEVFGDIAPPPEQEQQGAQPEPPTQPPRPTPAPAWSSEWIAARFFALFACALELVLFSLIGAGLGWKNGPSMMGLACLFAIWTMTWVALTNGTSPQKGAP